jgi:hypothetical protein
MRFELTIELKFELPSGIHAAKYEDGEGAAMRV